MIWALAALASDCPDPDPLLRGVERDVVAYNLATAREDLEAAVQAFGCSPPVTAEQAHRYWLAQGVMWSYQGDERLHLAFAAARRADPTWNDAYGTSGPELEAWRAATDGAERFELSFANAPSSLRFWMDGASMTPPIRVIEGAHLLQVGDDQGIRHARALVVEGPQVITLPDLGTSTQSTNAPIPAGPIPSDPSRRRKGRAGAWALLSTGVLVAAGGTASAFGALHTRARYDELPTAGTYTANRALGVAAWTLWGTGAVFGGTGVVLLTKPRR